MIVHVLPSASWVDDTTFGAIVDVATAAENDIRLHLPALHRDVYLLVNQTDRVDEDGAYTIGPHLIRWDVNPSAGVERLAQANLRALLFHECHHSVRLQQRPEEAQVVDWPTVAVFEGLASVFADAAGEPRPPWSVYEPTTIEAWASELMSQPMNEAWVHWKFKHPDGREHIAYKVGTWIADRAVERSGRSAADLVWASPKEVIDLAQLSH